MKKFLWILALIGAVLGIVTVIFGLVTARGANREMAAVALGVALAVIPYCLARAAAELGK